MKKNQLLRIFIFNFSLLFTQFAFAQKSDSGKNINGSRQIKDISKSNYTSLKKQGALSENYEYRIDNGKVIPFNPAAKPYSPTNSTLTPCDIVPVQGSVGYNVEVDDSPLLTIPIPFNFCFYGTNYTSLNLSANGNVQFSSNSTSFSSTGFPSTAVNMIAPFWADGESMVLVGGRTYGKIHIDPHPTYMVISWDSMGYFNNHVDKLNSFQLVLTNGLDPILPPGKNVGFYYKKMQWTTGDASSGTNGFPTTQPGTPATIGANQGNGVDYFLIGRFGVPGSVYDGPLGNSDGISWLNGKRFFFDVCPSVGSNQAPTPTLIGPCDTIKLCGNDSLIIKNAFIGPELTQTVSINANAPTLGASFTYSVLQTGNNTDISMFVNGSTAPAGYHIVTMNATDNGVPAKTSSQTFVVFVDHSTVNNINGQIVFTPTIGVCPGGSTTASVVVSGGTPGSYLWNNNASTSSTSFTVTPALDSTVYVTIKSGQCQKTFMKYIKVNPVPVASISGVLQFCSGTGSTTILTASNTTNFAAQSPYTYAWSGSPAPSPVNTQTTNATGGTYSVIVTNKYNCKSTAVVTVTLNATPIFTVVPTNTTVCSSGVIPLSINFGTAPPAGCGLASTGCAVSNTFQVGTSTTNGSSSNYNPYGGVYESVKTQFLYTAAELNAAGIVAGKLNKIAFNVTNFNGNATAFSNFTIKLKCVSYSALTSGMDNTGLVQVFNPTTINATVGWNNYNFTQAYEWDGTSNLLVDVCFFNTTWDGNLSVEYSTLGFNASRYVNDDGINQCPLNTTDGVGAIRPNTRFGNCSSVANPNSYTYSWLPTTGLSSSSVSNPTANISASIQYTVVVTPTAAATCSNVGTASLTVITPATPTITAVSALCSNAASFTLSALPVGGTWSLTTATSTLGVFTPSLAAIGNNTVTYTYGGASCAQTTTAVVIVERFVPSTITGTINPICLPSLPINLATALITSTLGTGIWSGNGVTGTAFDPAAAGAGTHSLTYSTNSSPTATLCPSSSTIEVNINSVSQPTISLAGPFCTNASTFALSVTPVGGIWLGTGISSGGILTPSLATVGNNTYTYTVGSATCSAVNTTTISIELYVPSTITGTINPLCISDPMINLATALTTSTLGAGVWSGNGVSGNGFDPSIAGSGVHTLTYSTQSNLTATLCPSFSVIAVAVNSVVQPTITPAGPFCDNYAGQQMTVNPAGGVWSASAGSSVSASGLFTPSPILVGSNKLYYTLTNAPCVKKDSIIVDVIHFVPATIIGALGPYCIYEPSVNLQGIAQFTGGTWSGTGVSSGSFTPSAALAPTAVTPGTFVITYITNPSPLLNCGETRTTSIIVNPKPEANAFPDWLQGCNYSLPILFSTSTEITGTATWDFGDGSPNGNGLMVTHTYTNPGTYIATIIYTENDGCMDTTQIPTAIVIFPVPEAAFAPSLDVTTVINAEIVFTNQTSDLLNNAYNWNFGGLGTSTEVSPTYLFDNSGEYFVTLIAVSPDGCQDTAVKKITINPDVVLYVPNAFTPGNNDGLNDVFQIFLPPTGVDYTTFSLSIYNRWGELIFKTNDVNDSWTGAKNNSGPILKQDIFVWKIDFQDTKKKFYSRAGHVSLLHK